MRSISAGQAAAGMQKQDRHAAALLTAVNEMPIM